MTGLLIRQSQSETHNEMIPSAHEVLAVIRETETEYTLRVKTDVRVEHGQFFQISLPKVGEAPISVSAIEDGYVEFTIRSVGKVTAELKRIRKGDKIFMRGPYGNSFPIQDFCGKDLVVIAGGTGVSPVRSMLRYFYRHREEVTSLHFLAGFKDHNGVLFREDLELFRHLFETTYSLDNENAPGFEVGFVTHHVKRIPFSTFRDYNVVIVGPPVMMHYVALRCLEEGATEEKMWMSFERKMSCAVGKCGHCKIDETYVCLDGPVFNYSLAKSLLD